MAHWLDEHNIEMGDVDDETLERFIEHIATCRCACIRPGKHMHTKTGARRFLRYLRHEGIVPERQEVRDEGDALFERFSDWLRRHRGATDSTVKGYQPFVEIFMEALGTDPRQYDVTSIRGFVLTHYHGAQTSYAKAVASKIRMFLRFLVFEGKCPPSLLSPPDFVPDEQ
jgi:site-specific recombinase XerD